MFFFPVILRQYVSMTLCGTRECCDKLWHVIRMEEERGGRGRVGEKREEGEQV